MTTILTYTSVELYAARRSPVIQAIVLAAMRTSLGMANASLCETEPIEWLEAQMEQHRFFVIIIRRTTDDYGATSVQVLAFLLGRQLATYNLDGFPRAGIDMVNTYKGIEPAAVQSTVQRMATVFLRSTLELQRYICEVRRPGLVALVRSDEIHKVLLYRQVGAKFVLVQLRK